MGDKLRTPYNSIACRSTFSSNNLKYTFSVWLYQSLTSFWKNFGPHFFTMLIQFICLCTALASAFQAGCGLDFDWAITTPWLFSFQPFCWRLLVCLDHCLVAWPNFGHALAVIRMASHLFMVDSVTVRCPGPVATKQAQNHQPSTSLLDFWYEVFVLISSFGFHQMWRCALWSYISTLDIVLEVLWFVQMLLSKIIILATPNMPYILVLF